MNSQNCIPEAFPLSPCSSCSSLHRISEDQDSKLKGLCPNLDGIAPLRKTILRRHPTSTHLKSWSTARTCLVWTRRDMANSNTERAEAAAVSFHQKNKEGRCARDLHRERNRDTSTTVWTRRNNTLFRRRIRSCDACTRRRLFSATQYPCFPAAVRKKGNQKTKPYAAQCTTVRRSLKECNRTPVSMRDNMNTCISSERTVLYPYRPEHVEAYHEWMKDPWLQALSPCCSSGSLLSTAAGDDRVGTTEPGGRNRNAGMYIRASMLVLTSVLVTAHMARGC